MVRDERVTSVVGGQRVLFALGVLYLLLAVGWAVASGYPEEPPLTILIVSTFIGGSGVVLVLGGYRLPRTDVDPADYAVVARWSLGGIGMMLLILTLYNVQPDSGISDPARSVPILTGFSSVAGFGVGTYAAQAKSHARQLERQNRLLKRTQAQLEDSNDRLEQFAYAASHDLQEPLRMVSSYLQLIDRRYGDELDEDGEEFLAFAIDGADRMREMVEGLLEYSRVDTQGEPFESVDLDAVLAEVRKDLEVQVVETDAAIEVDALPRVEGDRSQLRQLFQNLLSNAIEYSGDEPPRIEVAATRVGDEWRFAVSDEGVGIDPADQDRIFEVFQRADSRHDHPGTGIGLALCKRIVERHDGEIRVESEPGDGATFSFTLPAVAGDGRDRFPRSDATST